jgi:hypothetical protein
MLEFKLLIHKYLIINSLAKNLLLLSPKLQG